MRTPVLGLLLLLGSAHAMIQSLHREYSPSNEFTEVYAFQFARSGHLTVEAGVSGASLALPNNTVQVLLLDQDMVKSIQDASLEDVCASIPYSFTGTHWSVSLGFNHSSRAQLSNWAAPHGGWVFLLQLNCDKLAYSMELNITAMNPGGEYLSVSQVPFKFMYLAAGSAWALTLLGWLVNWVPYRYFNVGLHSVLSLTPLLQCIVTGVSAVYWHRKSVSGHAQPALAWLLLFLKGLSRGVFFLSLLCLACGWRIVAPIPRDQCKRAGASLAGLVLAYWLYNIFQGFLLFVLVMSYTFVFRLIFAGILENATTLYVQAQLLRDAGIDTSVAPISVKWRLYRRLQTLLVVYVCTDVIFHLWAQIFLLKVPWVEDTVEQAIMLVMTAGLCFTYRMRPFSPYFKAAPVGAGVLAGGYGLLPSEDDQMALWRPGMAVPQALPADYAAWLNPDTAPFLLVSNPPSQDDKGHPRHRVAVAQTL